MRVLLLGGTGDGLKLARRLGPTAIYSLAGLGTTPDDLTCAVRVGGFGGAEGLAAFIAAEGIGLLVDATHPYAAQISANAARASKAAACPYWALRRPAWRAGSGDDWREVSDWPSTLAALVPFSRPLFTLGREPLQHRDAVPSSQHWVIRCLDDVPAGPRTTVIAARGPFTIEGERALFDAHRIDVVVSKNSGGSATEAKLDVARERGLPVIMRSRPELPEADQTFVSTDTLLVALDARGLLA